MQKTVILGKVESDKVYVSEVSDHKYYGLFTRWAHQCVGFISRQDCDEGDFRAMSFQYLTRADGWSSFSSSTLGGCIRNVIENCNFTVKQFDTWQELLQAAVCTD